MKKILLPIFVKIVNLILYHFQNLLFSTLCTFHSPAVTIKLTTFLHEQMGCEQALYRVSHET